MIFPVMIVAGEMTGMPWETPLQRMTNSLTGPVAFAVSLAGITAGIIPFIFGDELGQFTKIALKLTLGISVLVFATSFLSSVFGVSGATI